MSANAVKGKAALAVSREIGIEYKSAWVNLLKLREAVAAERTRLLLDGTVEIDGMYIGGHVRPKNRREERVDRRRENRNPDRRCASACGSGTAVLRRPSPPARTPTSR